MNYYNEIEPFAAEWLRNLISEKLIPNGIVDERSIKEVTPSDVRGFRQCHFFAGIAGWSLALQLAGWPADREVWTGSCPCQPYSAAGKGEGDEDPRNLWPDFFELIRKCRPQCIFGEQVENAIKHGWLDGVSADLEGEGYAIGSCVLGAHSVGAPHIRQRLFWGGKRVADASAAERGRGLQSEREHRRALHVADGGAIVGMANTELTQSRAGKQSIKGWSRRGRDRSAINGTTCGLANNNSPRFSAHAIDERDHAKHHAQSRGEPDGGLGNASESRPSLPEQPELSGAGRIDEGRATEQSGGAWGKFHIIPCRDERARRISSQPGDEPLAYGIPQQLRPMFAWLGRLGLDATAITRMARIARRNRVGRLKGYGNAIVPEVAAEFIKAFMET